MTTEWGEEKVGKPTFVPLCEQQEDAEASESQPTQQKVRLIISQMTMAMCSNIGYCTVLYSNGRIDDNDGRINCMKEGYYCLVILHLISSKLSLHELVLG